MLPDTTLGHYRVLGPLGKGGMGEVYAAEDTKLHRRVAIKMLPRILAADPAGRLRFEREAQAVAALNHPNIVTLYSVEDSGGLPFLTMELVDGRSLSEMIEDPGLPPDRIVRIGIAVADAMAAAHQRGITHRDLKPANVMVTADGRVKVLDFGLAKLQESGFHAASEDATRMVSGDLTGEGRIIGTVAYMSPEQAEGKPVDQRSDIFSLGVMLHEMTTGERPFKGDTDISVISAILKDTPSALTDLKPDVPTELARIVRRCLAKDPSRRYQTAADLRNDLEELKQDLDSGVAQRGPASTPLAVRPALARAPGRRTMLSIAGAVAIGVIAVLTFVKFGMRSPGPAAVFTADRITRLTDSGTAFLASLSADGRYVVHAKMEAGVPSLWVRQTATTSDVRIVAPETVRYKGVSFDPDGNFVYYVRYVPNSGVASLYKVAVLGGPAMRVLEDIDSAVSFSPDKSKFAFIRGNVSKGVSDLMVANADGSNARKLAAPSGTAKFQNEGPAWSPDGKTILVPSQDTRETTRFVFAVDATTGEMRRVPGDWFFLRNLEWMPDGRSFVMDGFLFNGTLTPQLWQIGYPSGERRGITNDLNGYIGVSLSADGRSLVTVQATTRAGIWILPQGADNDGQQITPGSGRAEGAAGIEWTPDGRIVYVAPDTTGYPQLWITDAAGSSTRPLTTLRAAAQLPSVSPDGVWLYYQVSAERTTLWRMRLDGSDQTQLTTDGTEFGPIVSADGQWLYFTSTSTGVSRPMRMPAGGGAATMIADVDFRTTGFVPDEPRLFGVAWNKAQRRSQGATLPIAGGQLQFIDMPERGLPRLIPGTREISYVDTRDGAANVFANPARGGAARQITRFRPGRLTSIFNYAWSRDGRLAISRGDSDTDVILIGTH